MIIGCGQPTDHSATLLELQARVRTLEKEVTLAKKERAHFGRYIAAILKWIGKIENEKEQRSM